MKGNRTNHSKKSEAESRCRKITVSLTIEEDQLVRERAAAAGKTVTKYIADLVDADMKYDQRQLHIKEDGVTRLIPHIDISDMNLVVQETDELPTLV